MDKEDIKWYFKKLHVKVYYSHEIERMRDIEKTFLEELLGEERVKEIYYYAKTCGLDNRKSNRLQLNRILREKLIEKLMEEYLFENA